MIETPIALDRMQRRAMRRAELIDRRVQIGGTKRTNLNSHSVDHQRVALVVADRIALPGRRHVRRVRLVHAHLTKLISVRIKDRDLVRLLDKLHRAICQN
jgi:hypothetical protein